MEVKELEDNNLICVTKANRLIEARYKLTLVEQKLILFAVANLRPMNQTDFTIQRFSIQDLASAIGIQDHRYTEIRKVVRELRKKEVIIQTDDKELITGWLSSIEFEKKTGIIELEFSKKLVPYLLQLEGAFKSYRLDDVVRMNSVHAIRIYEMIKQWSDKKREVEISVEDLRKRLMLDGEYKEFYDFEKRVLIPAKKEINEHSDLWISYKKIKKGRAIASICFEREFKYGRYDVKTDEIKREKENNVFSYDEVRALCNLEGTSISDKQLIELYDIATEKAHRTPPVDLYEYIKMNLEYVLPKAKTGLYSYLKKALENDYANARRKLRFYPEER